MTKRSVTKLILLLLIVGMLMPSQVWAATAVKNISVYSSSNIVDTNTTVSIYFNPTNTLVGGYDTINVRFPVAYQLDTGLTKTDITLNNQNPNTVSLSGNVLSLTMPANINIIAGQQVQLTIAGTKIKNPTTAGNYQLSVATSQDTTEVQSTILTVTDFEYSDGISKPIVTATTPLGGAALAFRITFKLPLNGTLTAGDKIHIIFPTDVLVPTNINPGYFTLNGKNLINSQITVSGKVVSITVPAGMYIPPQGSVDLLIDQGAPLLNQGSTSSTNMLLIYTSVNTRVIQSLPYTINANTTTPQNPVGTQNITVAPNPDGAEAQAAYTITIKPNVLSSLGSKLDGLIISFPDRTGLPEEIDPTNIKVNGLTAKGAMVNLNNKREIIFLLPTSVYTDQTITITLDQKAGIKNPTAAAYQLAIGAIQNSNTFSSGSYTINTQSTTNPTTPPNPSNPTNPPVNSIDKQIVLQLDNKIAYVDGVATTLNAPPTMISNTTMVPLRFIADSMGATIDYKQIGQYANVQYAGKEMTLWVNSTLAKVDGSFVYLQTPATMRNGSILVPVRFFTENFGAEVKWEEATRKITINMGEGGHGTTPNTPPAQDNTSKPYPIGYTVTVSAGNSKVNLRSGPGENYSIVGKLNAGEGLVILAVQDSWYKVQLTTGGEAWVASWVVDLSQG